MFKKFALAAFSALMFASNLPAADDLASIIANIDGAKDKAADVAVEDTLGQSDVDALLGDKKSDEKDAVAACYRRFGGGYGHSYGSYGGYGCYNNYSSYSTSYCYPSYSSYSCWTPSYCYTPTYSCVTPVSYTTCYSPCYTSYWGCW